jgi:hypothetical protein
MKLLTAASVLMALSDHEIDSLASGRSFIDLSKIARHNRRLNRERFAVEALAEANVKRERRAAKVLANPHTVFLNESMVIV